MSKMNGNFWNNNSPLQPLADRLQTLLPVGGPVENIRANPKLEKFRKAGNCYYDLYNNGLCNRAAEFRQVFGFSANAHRDRHNHWFRKGLFVRLEAAMTRIVLEAALEQLSDQELLDLGLTAPRSDEAKSP